MEFQPRSVPAQDSVRRSTGAAFSERDVAAVRLLLGLISLSDRIRHDIYQPLAELGLSEGKFSLLMVVKSEGSCPMSQVARRIGVVPATVSVMVKRMLAAPDPLISAAVDPHDARGRLLRLTARGEETVRRACAIHATSVRRFAALLSDGQLGYLNDLITRLNQSPRS